MGDDPEPDAGASQAAPDDDEPDLPTDGEESVGDGTGGDATDEAPTTDDDRAAIERADGSGVGAASAEEADGADESVAEEEATESAEEYDESATTDDERTDETTDAERLDPNVIPVIESETVYEAARADDGRLDPDVLPVIESEAVYETVRAEDRRRGLESGTTVDEPAPTVERDDVEKPAVKPEREAEPDSIDEGLFGSRDGPEDDEEMPLADHIEEMIKRLAVVFVVAGSVSLVTFPFADQIITFLWYSILPGGDVAQPRVYGPLEFLLARIKVASLAGLIVALPVIVYETYAFMKPGLYRNERKYYLAAIPTSLILALIGVAFAYFIVLPAIFTYFLAYSEAAGEIAFGLQRTFGLMLILMAYLAIVFQIPLFIMLAIMMGLTTRDWLADKRLYFWGAFLGVAFISSPDPTGMAPIIIALTMVGLYEGTLFVLKWVGR